MNLQYYENFIAIVEEGSLTGASRKIGVAQPALSNQLRAMEKTFGVRLFHRGGRRLLLTEAGKLVYARAKELCAVEMEARNEIASGFSGQYGTLRYGATSSVSGPVWQKLLTDFAKKYPNVNLRVVEGSHQELIRQLAGGVIEVALLRSRGSIPDSLEVLYSKKDVLVAAWKKDAPFMQNAPSGPIPYSFFNDHPLAVTQGMLRSNPEFLRWGDVQPDIRLVATRTQDCLRWAREGMGVTLLPRSALEELGYSDLACREMESGFLSTPALTLVAQKKRYRSQVAQNFVEMLALSRAWLLKEEPKEELRYQ